MPFLALTSGTTTGATKYIPVSRAMVASNRKAAQTMVASYLNEPPPLAPLSRQALLPGRRVRPAIARARRRPGGPERDRRARRSARWLRPYTFPPLDLALEPNWDRKLDAHVRKEPTRADHAGLGCVELPGHALPAVARTDRQGDRRRGLAERSRSSSTAGSSSTLTAKPSRPCSARRGSRLQESYPCSEGFIAFGDAGDRAAPALARPRPLLRVRAARGAGRRAADAALARDVRTGVNYAIVVSTCAGLWAHVIGDTVRFESLTPPLLTFTGRTRYSLSAFGEHLISEEVEGAVAAASEASRGLGARLARRAGLPRAARAPPVRRRVPRSPRPISPTFATSSTRNSPGATPITSGFGPKAAASPAPAWSSPRPGGFDDWMRSRGKLGGQHKVPRMDSSGKLTGELLAHLRTENLLERDLSEGVPP